MGISYSLYPAETGQQILHGGTGHDCTPGLLLPVCLFPCQLVYFSQPIAGNHHNTDLISNHQVTRANKDPTAYYRSIDLYGFLAARVGGVGRTGSHRLCTDRESQKACFIGVAAAAIDYGTRNSPAMRQAGHQPPPDRSFYLAESEEEILMMLAPGANQGANSLLR